MAIESIGSLSDGQLISRVAEAERDMVAMKFQHSLNQLENTATLAELRKDIARLRTEARTREVAQGLGKDTLLNQKAEAVDAGGAVGADGDKAESEKGGFLSSIVDKLSGKE